MARITFLLGLCGSGKSYLAEQMEKDNEGVVFEGVVGNGQVNEMVECVKTGNDCIVEEISFCLEQNRILIVRQIEQAAPGTQIEWVCFDNDLEAANWNVAHRTNKGDVEGHIDINRRVSPMYTFPEKCVRRSIVRIANRLDTT